MAGEAEMLREILRDLGRFEERLDFQDQNHVAILRRLDAIDSKQSNAALSDAGRIGMVKGGYWVLGFVALVIASMSSALTLVVKSWLGLLPPTP